ncbi:hypothetical protein [Fibrivirga algicola]|uniref:XRE family transcriptional regulator n=1 Tax=Fibrivirga algicola TaxID=2950420 RepID=A0ABX0QMM6_9BACT|nr:hypothetical protein [Fibrivirga algicola]NID13751.1 hypothetical protein [Fibrivirga algicola]
MSNANKRTVYTDPLTVEHWRERLTKLIPKKMTLKDLAERIASEDKYFEGITGYSRLTNIVNSRGGLQATNRLVLLLERLDLKVESGQEEPATSKVFKRQKINLLD